MAQPGRPSYRYHMTHRVLTNFSEHDFRDSNVPSNGYSVPGRDSPQTPSGQPELMDPRKRRPDPPSRGNSPLEKRNKYQNDVPTHPSKHSAPGRPGISSSQSLSRRSSGAGPSVMPMKPPSSTESMQNPGNHGRPSQYGQSQATSGAERPREPSIGNSSVVTVSPEGLENRTPTTMERAPPVPSMRPQAPGAIVGPNLRENPSISHPNHSSQRARATNTDLPHTLASLQRMKARKAAMSQKSSELAPDQLYTQIGELRRQFAEEREERNKERVEMSNQIKSLQDQLAIEQTQRSNDSGRLEKLETTISTHLESTAKAFEATKSFAAVSAEVKAHSNDINSFKTWKESQISRATADQNADAIRSHVDQQAVTRVQEGMEKLNAQVFEKFEKYSSQHKRDMAKLTEENNQFSSELQEKFDSQNYHDRILAQERSLSKLKEKFDSQNYHDRILAQEQSLSKLNSRLSDIEKTKVQSTIDTVTKLSELKEKLDSQNYHDRILAQEQSLSKLNLRLSDIEKTKDQSAIDTVTKLSELKEKLDSQNYHDRILALEQSLSNLNSRLSDIEKTKDQPAYDTVTENLNTLLSSIDKTEEDLHNIRINMTALKDDIPQSFARLLDAMKADLEQKFKYINTRMDQQSKEITQLKNQTSVASAQAPIPPYATIHGHEGLAKNLEKLKDDLDGTTNNLDMEISMRDKHCKDLQLQLDKARYIIQRLEDRYSNITTTDLYQKMTNWFVQTYSPAVNVAQRLPQLENDFYKLYNSLGSLDEFAGQLREWRALTGYTEDLKRLPQLYHDFDRLRSEASKDNDTLKRNVDFNRALADELSKDCENLKKAITQLTADRTSTTQKQLIEELQKNVRRLENSIRATEISVHFEREERENTTKRLDLDLTNLQAMEETQAKAIDRMKGLMADEDQKLSNRVESRLDGLRHQLDTIMGAYVNDNMELFGAWPGIVCAMIEIQKVVQDLNRNLDPAKRLKIQWTDVGDLMNQIKQTAAKK